MPLGLKELMNVAEGYVLVAILAAVLELNAVEIKLRAVLNISVYSLSQGDPFIFN